MTTQSASISTPLNSGGGASERVLQASYLIPSYQKALPRALLHECSDDYRLRKIETTCCCKVDWGRLPGRLAERYCLLQLAFDPKRGNFLGALNLLRQYFLGHMALIPFQQTLLRANGSQVTKKYPTSLDDCRLLMPHCDRFGRVTVDLASALAADRNYRAAASANRNEACRRLADRLMESCTRCLATHAAFVAETEARQDAAAVAERAEKAAAQAAAAEAATSEVVETVAQCELCRATVCALVEVVEATRLLEQLDSRRWAAESSRTPHGQHGNHLVQAQPQSLCRRSQSPSRRRIDFQLSPSPQQQQQQQALAAAATTMHQANNHHRPASRVVGDPRRRQQQQPPQQQEEDSKRQRSRQSRSRNNRQQSNRRRNCQRGSNPDESCATTLADVEEAITFAESEYVDNGDGGGGPLAAASSGSATETARPTTTTTTTTTSFKSATPPKMPESLLLCGIQPSAASALCALDRSDRRLKAIERRTGCRLELRQRRCFGAGSGGDCPGCCGGDCGCSCVASQQVSYAIQVTPAGPNSRPRGCANMLRALLRGLEPSCRFCVVPAATASAVSSATCHQQQQQQQHRRQQRQQQQKRQRQQATTLITPAEIQSSAVTAAAGRLLRRAVVDCLLGASATAAAVAANACVGGEAPVVGGIVVKAFCRRLELRREAVLGGALLCVFRSLTATEADARLLGEALDGSGADADMVLDAVHRTLVACAAERRIDSGLMGAFACLRSPEPPATASASSSLATVSTASTAGAAATASLLTMSVRRRLARLVVASWERLCTEALCSGAGAGVDVLLEAAAAEAVASAAVRQLTSARLALSFCRRRRRQLPVEPADCSTDDNDLEAEDNVDLRRHRCRHRRRPSSSLGWQLRRAAVRSATVQEGRLAPPPLGSSGSRRRSSAVLTLKRLFVDLLESGVDERLTVAAALTRLACDLVAEQMWNACVKVQVAMRLPVRPL